jgi:hypothetical protein
MQTNHPAPRFNLPGVYYPEPTAPKPVRTYRPGPKPGATRKPRTGALPDALTPAQKTAIEAALRDNLPLKPWAHEAGIPQSTVMAFVDRTGWRRLYLSRAEQDDLRQRRHRAQLKATHSTL